FDTLVVGAGFSESETFDAPEWAEEMKPDTICTFDPLFVVQALVAAGEGGVKYAHHASKSALNMAGKLLSLDLKERGMAVAIVHPGFMRTEMSKNVEDDQCWDSGGAVT
ncbi:hypothetical protein DFH09DRAFT_821354, partial [Mycena vulgaris]